MKVFRPWCAALAASLATTACSAETIDKHLPWRSFYAAGASMEPTLPVGTQFKAKRVAAEDLRRGDVVIVLKGDEEFVMRLAGLPGDRIALVDGIVVLNGTPVVQRVAGRRAYSDSPGRQEGTVLSERFPGELKPHRILDTGYSPGDNTPEILLGSDRYFLLGDNRDHAADSRYPAERFGLGVVRGERIRRRVALD